MLAFICDIKQNLKDKEILCGLVFSSGCWLRHILQFMCRVLKCIHRPYHTNKANIQSPNTEPDGEACDRPSYAVTLPVYIVRPIY